VSQVTREWIGVDLDGTLARSSAWKGSDHIGEPIPAMVDRVKVWLSEGKDVRLFTARAFNPSREEVDLMADWCEKHLGRIIPITCEKDMHMAALYDDRAVQVIKNTGELVGEAHDAI
jgi:hypothetical protein